MATFKNLFEVIVSHSYFKNKNTSDLTIVPTSLCAQLIKGRKLIFKTSQEGFKILYKSVDNEGTPLIALDEITFTFAIYLNNTSEFLSFTRLNTSEKEYSAGKIVYFKNDPVDKKKLDFDLLDFVKPDILTYRFPFIADDPQNDEASFEIEDRKGATVVSSSQVKPNESGEYNLRIDLSEEPVGKYYFKSSDNAHDLTIETIYIDNELARQKLFGFIEIEYNEDSRSKYILKFKRNISKWAYYLVNKSGISFDDYNLEILDDSGDDGTGIYQTYTFTGNQAPDPDDSINGYETLSFVSNKKIPFYEIPKLNLKLKKVEVSGPAEIVLIKNLPNPDLNTIINKDDESEILVYI